MKITNKYQPSTELDFKSSVGNLNPIINVNSLDGTTVFRYNGKYANINYMRPWGYGEVLPIASSGTDPTFGAGSPLLGNVDDSIKFNGGTVFQANNNTFANVTTEDLYFEGFFKTPASLSGVKVLFSKYGSSAVGYFLYTNDTSLRFFTDGVGGETNYVQYNTVLSPNTWYFVSIFRDASETSQINGFQLYVNALNNSTYSNAYTPADVGSITNTNEFTIGSYNSFANKGDGNMAYLAMAKRASWFAGGATNLTQWAALHQERYSKLKNLHSILNSGLVPESF